MKNIFRLLFVVFFLFTIKNLLYSQWTQNNTGLTNTHVNALAVSGTHLFAGTWGGVFLSTNNGTSWVRTKTGLTSSYVHALAVSGTNLFAGSEDKGVFLSTNNGTSWTAVNTGLTNLYIWSFAVSSTNLFAGTSSGVFLSTNNGTSWFNTSSTNSPVYALAVSGTNLFAGTYGDGVFLSTNSGTSWTAVNTGLTNTSVMSLAFSGTNLFAGTNGGGIFLSTNNGTNWVNTGLTSSPVSALAISSTNLFAGTWGAGVHLSTDNSTNWTAVNTGLTNNDVWSFAVSPDGAGGTNLFAGTSGGIFQLIFAKPLLSPTLNSPSNGGYLIEPQYTFTWQAVSNAGGYQIRIADDTLFTSPIINDQSIAGSAISYSISTTLTLDQTYYWQMRTLDSAGTHWGFWGTYQSFVAVPGDGSYYRIHLNFEQEKVTFVNFFYVNGAVTNIEVSWTLWNSFSSDIALKDNESRSVNGSYSLTMHKIDSTQVLVTLDPHNLSVFCTGDYASYWYSNSQTQYQAFYYYDLGTIREHISASITSLTGISSSISNEPKRFTLEQNYPNPFNPSTNITFNLPSKSFVSLKIFDVIGREVAILVAQKMSAGNHSFQWNAATMPSGVYFYRLQAGSFTETKKLVLLR